MFINNNMLNEHTAYKVCHLECFFKPWQNQLKVSLLEYKLKAFTALTIPMTEVIFQHIT